MGKMTFYNDNDPKICAWLRQLMANGLISKGKIVPQVAAEFIRAYLEMD